MSQLDHLANRIGWRARKNAVWTKNTRMWKDASQELKERVGESLERPVFFSVADDSEGVVFGADGALVVTGEKDEVIPYKDLAGVRCSEVGIATPADKGFILKLNVRSKGTIRAKVEGGAAGYGVWRVLQMVLNMDQGWFDPEAEPEPVESEGDAQRIEPGEAAELKAEDEANSNVEAQKTGNAPASHDPEPVAECEPDDVQTEDDKPKD